MDCGFSGFGVAVGTGGVKVAFGMTIKIVGVIVRVSVAVNTSVGDSVGVPVNAPVSIKNRSVGDRVGVDRGGTSCCALVITIPAAQTTTSIPIRARIAIARRRFSLSTSG